MNKDPKAVLIDELVNEGVESAKALALLLNQTENFNFDNIRSELRQFWPGSLSKINQTKRAFLVHCIARSRETGHSAECFKHVGKLLLDLALLRDCSKYAIELMDAGVRVCKNDIPISSVAHGDVELLDALARAKYDFNLVCGTTGHTALMLACANSNIAVCDRLLDYGARVDIAKVNGATAVNFAAVDPEMAPILKRMLSIYPEGANQPNCKGNTPLHFANGECTRVLLDAGADPTWSNDNGETAYDLAYGGNDELKMKLLSERVELAPAP